MKMKRLRATALAICLMVLTCTCSCAYLQKAHDVLCDPTQEMQTEAQAAIGFLNATFALVGYDNLQVDLLKAVFVFDLVRASVCVAYDQLAEALNTVDQAQLVLAGQAGVEKALRVTKPYPVAPAMPQLKGLVK